MDNPSSRLSTQGQAILHWFNGVDPVPRGRSARIEDLADGQRIWDTLQDLDPSLFAGRLPESTNRSGKWLSGWQNLKFLCKPLAQFITERGGQLPGGARSLDLKAVAMGNDGAETAKVCVELALVAHLYADLSTQLLKMVLFVAVHSEDNARYIQTMMALPPDGQKHLQDAIMEVGAWYHLLRSHS